MNASLLMSKQHKLCPDAVKTSYLHYFRSYGGVMGAFLGPGRLNPGTLKAGPPNIPPIALPLALPTLSPVPKPPFPPTTPPPLLSPRPNLPPVRTPSCFFEPPKLVLLPMLLVDAVEAALPAGLPAPAAAVPAGRLRDKPGPWWLAVLAAGFTGPAQGAAHHAGSCRFASPA